jgi:hypothetical protein
MARVACFSNTILYVFSPFAGMTSHLGPVEKAKGIPPFVGKSFLDSWDSFFCVSLFILLMGLKLSSTDGRSATGLGLREPKNADGLEALEIDRVLWIDDGLDGAFEGAVGLKARALALGLNSMAFTLNLVETVDVGVCTLDRCGLETLD